MPQWLFWGSLALPNPKAASSLTCKLLLLAVILSFPVLERLQCKMQSIISFMSSLWGKKCLRFFLLFSQVASAAQQLPSFLLLALLSSYLTFFMDMSKCGFKFLSVLKILRNFFQNLEGRFWNSFGQLSHFFECRLTNLNKKIGEFHYFEPNMASICSCVRGLKKYY